MADRNGTGRCWKVRRLLAQSFPRSSPVLWSFLLYAGLSASGARASLSWKDVHRDLQPLTGAATIETEFEFTNHGADEVHITRIEVSCGCMTTKLAKANFAPGEPGKLQVTLNTAGLAGRQAKTIEVWTSDAPEKPATLRLDFTLITPYQLSPRLLRWSRNAPTKIQRADLVFDSSKEWKRPILRSSPPGFNITIEPVPGNERAFVLHVVPHSTGVPYRRLAELELEAVGGPPVTLSLVLVID